jgi:DnaJ-class molecular chaperone
VDERSVARNPRTITSRERRECRSCYGSGVVVEDAAYDFETGELIQVIGVCPICHGAGEISVYCYPKVRWSW